jgi:type I restriction enzyme S subunit
MYFEDCALADVADVIDSLHKTPSYVDVGYPMVRVTDVKYGQLDLTKTFRVAKETYLEFSLKYKPTRGDIIVTRVGSYGIFGKVFDTNFCLGQNTAAIVPKNISANYLYAVLNSAYVNAQIESLVVGSTQKTLSLKAIKEIRIPRLSNQQEKIIAEIAANIDDRITLLHETNQTLEAIAQTIFKSWFIDFDPVRAKAQGLKPEGMDAETAALFPDGFEETELGIVPKGWPVKSLSAFITESTRRIGDEPATVLSAVQTGYLVMSSDFFNKRVHSKDISKYKAVEPYSYAYNPSRVNIGSIGINEMGVVGAVSPIYVVANPKNISFGYYLWHLLRTNRIRESIKTMSSGTVRQSLSFKDFASIKVALPPDENVQYFFELRDEIFKNINLKENQISVLSKIRETLLPALISGQLCISDAEAELKKATA